ncbi:30S ribosomal protein S7 [Candidatus Peregrinibacteria bacterium]|nr:30S ribosomal protein S7 [Candidatus Peregrinibacteria bacterium]
MQKRIRFTPHGSNPLYEKFINCIMRDGKKSTARRIFNDCMKMVGEKTKEEPTKIFSKALDNVKPQMEVKPKRIGGGVYQIPYEVNANRQITLAFRWLIGAARKNKGAAMYIKLANEVMQAAEGTGAAIKKRDETHKMAAANKAFAHYARY